MCFKILNDRFSNYEYFLVFIEVVEVLICGIRNNFKFIDVGVWFISKLNICYIDSSFMIRSLCV